VVFEQVVAEFLVVLGKLACERLEVALDGVHGFYQHCAEVRSLAALLGHHQNKRTFDQSQDQAFGYKMCGRPPTARPERQSHRDFSCPFHSSLRDAQRADGRFTDLKNYFSAEINAL
jgi:hypothetical protein